MLLAALVPAAATARDVTVPVDARAGPWSVAANPQLPYGAGDAIAPVVVTGFPSEIDGKLEIIADGTTTPAKGAAVDAPPGSMATRSTTPAARARKSIPASTRRRSCTRRTGMR